MKRVILVGTISNAERKLRSDVYRVIRSLSSFELVQTFLVESDSTDTTVSILVDLKSELKNFDFISLGKLDVEIPDRISRIRHCRNVYVSKIRDFLKEKNIDYVVVADLDGMNSRISAKAIDSSMARQDWGAVIANQGGGYYDLLALRHPNWCPRDVMKELKIEQFKIDKSPLPKLSSIRRIRRRIEFDRARVSAIYSKMRVIEKDSDWIEVSSGFGGLGIYRASIFERFDYSLLSGDLEFESEHVALSKRITSSGGEIYINPRMINNYFNTYNINRFLIVRQLREIYWNSLSRFKALRKK